MNAVNDQATNETTVQHITPLCTTQRELLEDLHPIFEHNYEIIKKQLPKKEFILQTAAKHYLIMQSK